MPNLDIARSIRYRRVRADRWKSSLVIRRERGGIIFWQMLTPRWRGIKPFFTAYWRLFFFFFLPPRFSCNSKVMGSSVPLQLGFKREFPCYHQYRCPMKDTNCKRPRGTRTKMPAGRRGLNVHMICVAPILCSFILIALRHARMDVMMDTIPR